MNIGDVARGRWLRSSGLFSTALIGLMLAGIVPVSAQFHDYRYFGYRGAPVRPPAPVYEEFDVSLDAREVSLLLRRRGLNQITGLRREGDTYIANVETRQGERLRVMVDAYDGQIIERQRIAPIARRHNIDRDPDVTSVPRRDALPGREAAPARELGQRSREAARPVPVPQPPVRQARPAQSDQPEVTLPGQAPALAKPPVAAPGVPARAVVIEIDPRTGLAKGARPAVPDNKTAQSAVSATKPVRVVPLIVAPLDDAARPATPAVPVMPLE
jgi:hypothetical protein